MSLLLGVDDESSIRLKINHLDAPWCLALDQARGYTSREPHAPPGLSQRPGSPPRATATLVELEHRLRVVLAHLLLGQDAVFDLQLLSVTEFPLRSSRRAGRPGPASPSRGRPAARRAVAPVPGGAHPNPWQSAQGGACRGTSPRCTYPPLHGHQVARLARPGYRSRL